MRVTKHFHLSQARAPKLADTLAKSFNSDPLFLWMRSLSSTNATPGARALIDKIR